MLSNYNFSDAQLTMAMTVIVRQVMMKAIDLGLLKVLMVQNRSMTAYDEYIDE